MYQARSRDDMEEAGYALGNHCDGVDEKDRLIEELREAVRARDEFVAIAAHELRNPMTPILMQVSSLLAATRDVQRCRPEILTSRVEALEFAVREFVRRATTLLDVSRIAAGNVRIEPSEVDLSAIVHGVMRRLTTAARMGRCHLEAEVQEGVVGIWDRLAVEQVTENLLSNAIKFGAGRPVTVTLHTDDQAARLTIRDRGIGISEEDQARIFGRFEQAIGRREQGGFGVGLWLAHRFIAAMGGAIAVESALGKGSVFTVTLPLGVAGQQETSG